MTRYLPLYQWRDHVSSHLPALSQPQATVLALWSFGMVLARSCALTAVVTLLGPLLAVKDNTLRQRLREWCYDAPDKRGPMRQALDVRLCFAPLLAWVLSLWQGRLLAFALDATSLGDRFVVLTVSVLYRSCAIPVAWVVVPASHKGAWRPHWLRLLRLLWCTVPPDMTVLVLTDRGLYARWLFRRIVRLGWHPLMRINGGGYFRPEGGNPAFRPLSSFAFQPGSQWCGRGQAFKDPAGRLACTFVALWQPGMTEPWLLLTDLSPTAVAASWYGLRMWVEVGYKAVKSGGWQWQHTRMTDPRRAERLWLAVAVATLWLLSVGTETDTTIPVTPFADLAAALVPAGPTPRSRRATRLRLVSVFRRGWCRLLVALLRLDVVLPGTLTPEPWPTQPDLAPGST